MTKEQIDTATSLALQDRIRELMLECIEIGKALEYRGQFVASYGIDDAVDGLDKTIGCWNNKIEW